MPGDADLELPRIVLPEREFKGATSGRVREQSRGSVRQPGKFYRDPYRNDSEESLLQYLIDYRNEPVPVAAPAKRKENPNEKQ